MKTLSQTVHTLIDHTLQALSAFFPGRQDKIQQQQLQSMFDHRVLSHRDIIIDPRVYPLVTPPQSHQNEAPVSLAIQEQLDYWHKRRASQSLHNRKIDEQIIQSIKTKELPPFRKPVLYPLDVEEMSWLNSQPLPSTEPLHYVDQDATLLMEAIKHGG